MTSLRLAILNLSRKKVPSSIAVVSIALSVACSGILMRLNDLSESRIARLGRGFDAIVGAKAGGIEIILGALGGEGDEPGFLPYKLYESLKAERTVRFEDGAEARPSFLRTITPMLQFGRLKNFRVAGTDESFASLANLSLAAGHWAGAADEVVVGSRVAELESLHVGDSVSITASAGPTGPNRDVSLKVAGIFSETSLAWDAMMFTNVETAQRTLSTLDLSHVSIWGPNVLNYFLVNLDPNGFDSLESLVNRRTVGQAILVSDQKERLANLSGTGTDVGLFVTILILFLGALSVASMLLTRFEAMSTQIAVLRAIGYRRGVIASWLVWEGFLFGLAACAIGIVLDLAGFPLMRDLLGAALPSPDIVGSSIFQSAPIWVTAICSTTASVFFPMWRIYRQDVHFSLRN